MKNNARNSKYIVFSHPYVPKEGLITKAHIYSLDGQMDTVKIVEHKDNNHVVAEYKGNLYTAVYNLYVFAYYVDDVYGFIRKADDK